MVKTNIIATIGPASGNQTVLRKMIRNGLDCVRFNFSHGSLADHLERLELVRELNRKMRRAVKVMLDLEGFRIRIGRLKEPVELKRKREYYFIQEDAEGEGIRIPFDYTGPLSSIPAGSLLHVDDGKLILEVLEVKESALKVKSLSEGALYSKKGINIPGVNLPFDAVTEKDRRDLYTAIEYKFDYAAQSFVRNAADVIAVRDILKAGGSDCSVVSKIENRSAVANIDEIIDASDAVMVARGDLGICFPVYQIPALQKNIVKKVRSKNKPVIVATQMLDSMTYENLPTRAEVTDVANAIYDGATHVMLSGETAIGSHPDLVVDMMNKIIKHTEE